MNSTVSSSEPCTCKHIWSAQLPSALAREEHRSATHGWSHSSTGRAPLRSKWRPFDPSAASSPAYAATADASSASALPAACVGPTERKCQPRSRASVSKLHAMPTAAAWRSLAGAYRACKEQGVAHGQAYKTSNHAYMASDFTKRYLCPFRSWTQNKGLRAIKAAIMPQQCTQVRSTHADCNATTTLLLAARALSSPVT